MGTQPGTNWARHTVTLLICQWCFDAVGWVAGRASGLKNWKVTGIDDSMRVHYMAWWHSGQGVVICLQRGADLHMAADVTATHCLLLQ